MDVTCDSQSIKDRLLQTRLSARIVHQRIHAFLSLMLYAVHSVTEEMDQQWY